MGPPHAAQRALRASTCGVQWAAGPAFVRGAMGGRTRVRVGCMMKPVSTLREPRPEWFPRGRRAATARFRRVVPAIRTAIRGEDVPSVTEIARRSRSPLKVLVSTVISARTKDEVTAAASRRLFAEASTPRAIAALAEKRIAGLIYPAGFYRTKARAIRALSTRIAGSSEDGSPTRWRGFSRFRESGERRRISFSPSASPCRGSASTPTCTASSTGSASSGPDVPSKPRAASAPTLPKGHWLEINDLLVTFGKTFARRFRRAARYARHQLVPPAWAWCAPGERLGTRNGRCVGNRHEGGSRCVVSRRSCVLLMMTPSRSSRAAARSRSGRFDRFFTSEGAQDRSLPLRATRARSSTASTRSREEAFWAGNPRNCHRYARPRELSSAGIRHQDEHDDLLARLLEPFSTNGKRPARRSPDFRGRSTNR